MKAQGTNLTVRMIFFLMCSYMEVVQVQYTCYLMLSRLPLQLHHKNFIKPLNSMFTFYNLNRQVRFGINEYMYENRKVKLAI